MSQERSSKYATAMMTMIYNLMAATTIAALLMLLITTARGNLVAANSNPATLSPATRLGLLSLANVSSGNAFVAGGHKEDGWREKSKPKTFISGGIHPPQSSFPQSNKATGQERPVGPVLMASAMAAVSAVGGSLAFDSQNCDNVHLHDIRGTIRSPLYPSNFHNYTSCTWHIIGAPNDIITISFDDIDLSPQRHCPNETSIGSSTSTRPCCASSWITIQNAKLSEKRIYCGRGADNRLLLEPFISSGNHVIVRFNSSFSANNHNDRGFHLSYIIGPPRSKDCPDFQCRNGKCIPERWRCNRRDECLDNSDELDCEDVCASPQEVRCGSGSGFTGNSPTCYSFPLQRCDGNWNCYGGEDEKGCFGCPKNFFYCPSGRNCYSEAKRCDGFIDCSGDFSDELNCGCGPNKTQCSSSGLSECYDPFTQRCDRIINCPNANDELGCSVHGCENKILCSSGTGCYPPEERCNGVPFCSDFSDETNCTTEVCRSEHGSYLCSNGRCIRSSWVCDRSNDCGNASDEVNCLKNSVITAAIMGSLICGLLLVIAISCTCKLIALRQVEHQQQLNNDSPVEVHSHRSQSYPRSFPYPCNDSDTPLFRLEHEFFYREPPPSYSQAVGTHTETPYDRQSRRQHRRLRRHHRRRPPSPPPLGSEESPISSGNGSAVSTVTVGTHVSTSPNQLPPSSTHHPAIVDSCLRDSPAGDKTPERRKSYDESPGDGPACPESNSTSSPTATTTTTAADVSIELDSIPSPSQIDCDEQPLLS